MSSFNNLLNRLGVISEAKVSPYAAAHPAFGPVTSKMRAGGLSSAPLDTIKFIRDTLYYMDILNDQEFDTIKKAPGFTGKKQAMLAALKAKQDTINQRKDEIAARIEDTLDDFIGGIGVNRSREEKYAAQAAANEIAKEVRKAKSGKKLDDALMDTINMDTILVKASVAKILGEIQTNLGEPGFDIDPDALEEVVGYAENIDTLAKLKSFIKQISAEPGYEIIAAYLSSAVKPIEKGAEDEEMVEDEETDPEVEYDPSGPYGMGVDETEYDEVMAGTEDEEYDPKKADLDKDGVDEEWEKRIAKKRGFKVAKESYTALYISDEAKKIQKGNTVNEGVTFKERMKPKTSWQLQELRNYGL